MIAQKKNVQEVYKILVTYWLHNFNFCQNQWLFGLFIEIYVFNCNFASRPFVFAHKNHTWCAKNKAKNRKNVKTNHTISNLKTKKK